MLQRGGLDRLPGLVRAAQRARRRCARWTSPAPRRRGRSRRCWRRCRAGAARRGDLPVQPLHQHRADPGDAGHAGGDRGLRRAGDRGLADHRRAGGEGADGEDVRRARARRRPPPPSPRATAICWTAMSWRKATTPRPASRPRVCRAARDADAQLDDQVALARAVLAAADWRCGERHLGGAAGEGDGGVEAAPLAAAVARGARGADAGHGGRGAGRAAARARAWPACAW